MAVTYNSSRDPKDVAANNRALIQQKGDQLSQDQGNELGGNEALRNDYRSTLDRIYQPQAEGQGGYSPEEIAAIQRAGGVVPTSQSQLDSNFLTPDEEAGIRGDTGSYTKYFDPNQLNQQQDASAGLQRNAVNNLKTGLTGDINEDALSQSGKYQQDSANQLDQNQGQFGTVLGADASNVRGAIDPNAVTASQGFLDDYNMTPEEQQNIITSAGISAGAKDAAAVDAEERSARAAGSSPEGVAAYRARMARAQAADAGDAMTKARVDASNAAAARKLSGEQLREQGGQYLTNTKVGSEQHLGDLALSGTQQLGQQALDQRAKDEAARVADEQFTTGAKLNATATGGEADIANEANINNQGRQQGQYNATTGTGIAEAQDAATSGRAGTIAGNRQTTNVNNQNTQFNQGQAVDNTQSARAKEIADTRLGQQTQGLNYYQGQNEQANQNVQNDQNRQIQTYGTQTSGTNQAGGLGLQASQQPGLLGKIVGGVTGLFNAAGSVAKAAGSADGGIFTEPTASIIGEDGPEYVSSADGSGKVVDRPTMALLGDDGADVVTPLSYRAHAKVRPSPATVSRSRYGADASYLTPGAMSGINGDDWQKTFDDWDEIDSRIAPGSNDPKLLKRQREAFKNKRRIYGEAA